MDENVPRLVVAYNKEHKNTKVPQNYKEDVPLGTWVNNQRAAHRNKKMADERKRLLNKIISGHLKIKNVYI